MSNTRYIEIDSTYRNRNEFPFPAQFTLYISQSGSKTKTTALDPISDAAAKLVFSPNDFDISGGLSVTGTVDAIVAGTVGSLSTPLTFVAQFPVANSLQQIEDYYVGATVDDTTISAQRRILSIKYLNTSGGLDRFEITVANAFPDTFAAGNTIIINNPSDITDTSNPLFFLPLSESANDYYINNILYNQTLNDSRSIISYDGISHLALLDGTTPIVGWTLTNTYVLRKINPQETGTLTGGSINTFILPATSSTEDDFYKGDFIRITSGAAVGDQRLITSYDGATLTGTVYPMFSGIVNVGDTYEILPFTKDNFNPFAYTGSLVSQQNEVCYEIQLLSLTLPNTTLSSGNGSRIAFYPYVYVELSNFSTGSLKNIIYSNNPNSTKMLFRVPVDNVTTPLLSSFITLDSTGATQTVKFKPNDNLMFSVRLPNGELFKTKIPETISPVEPDPLIQISATFSIKRL